MTPITPGLTPGAWRHSRARREHSMWQVVDKLREPIAVVYTHEADARLMAASKDLLIACAGLLSILRPLAHDGRLSPDELEKVEAAVSAMARAVKPLNDHATVSSRRFVDSTPQGCVCRVIKYDIAASRS